MKKYFILFICLIGVLFSSCVEKEDPYSWSIGQMEIDESSPEVVTEEKVELPPTTKAKSNAPYAVVLETKFMKSQMLMLVQIPDNPFSKYDYWKDSELGQTVDWLNKNANGDSESWKNTIDTLSHAFNRTKLDTDLEKIYNVKHLAPDALGLEPDDSRYDARKYEDPMRRKIKGVSGYDIYKSDKRIQSLQDEIDELKKQISVETDSKKIEKLKKQIDDDLEEIEIISQKLDSEESKGTRTEELYNKKIKNIGSTNNLRDVKFAKGIAFVKNHQNDLIIMHKCLSNQ